MKKACLGFSAAVVLTATAVPLLHAASQPPTFWKGGAGLWQTPTNWTTGIPTATTASATIDGQPGVNSIVTLVGAGAARALSIDLGDQLLIGDATSGDDSTLTVENLTNAGLISPGHGQSDTLTYTGNFTNTGTIAANNNSILILNGADLAAAIFVNNGLIDIGELSGDTTADAEFNASNAGTMTITGSGNISIHDGGSLTIMNPVTINSTGYLNNSGGVPSFGIASTANLTFAGVTGTSDITASQNPVNFTLNTPANTTSAYAGAISGNITLAKNGAGTQIFSGNNFYAGTTDINSGTLQLDNTSLSNGGAGSGDVTVHAGGTLAGIGSTFGHTLVEDGGTIAPGDNGPGTLTIGLTLLLQPGSTLKMDIGNTPATSDLLRVANGEFDAAGVNVQFIPHGSLAFHQSYTFLNYSGAITVDAPIDPSDFILLPSGVTGNFVVDNNADTVSFFVLADAGDANEDGKVDLSDLNIVLNHLGTASSAWTDGNFDGAPTIDLTDLNDVLNTLGTTSIAPAAVAAPEPMTLTLAAVCFPLAAVRRRRLPVY